MYTTNMKFPSLQTHTHTNPPPLPTISPATATPSPIPPIVTSIQMPHFERTLTSPIHILHAGTRRSKTRKAEPLTARGEEAGRAGSKAQREHCGEEEEGDG